LLGAGGQCVAAEVELPWRALRSLSAHLTERDRRLLRLLAELRLLTTWQVAAVEFGSAITARHRMQVLSGLKVVQGFRPRVERGSSPMHYVLAQLGAAVVAEERSDATREQVKALLRRVRADHRLAIAPVAALAHQVGVNDLYCALIARAARLGQGAWLVQWRGERRLREETDNDLRADGFGWWREDGWEVAFLLEYDRGTERLRRLAEKLEHYQWALADSRSAWWFRNRPESWVLFAFQSIARERNARAELRLSGHAHGLRVATAVLAPGVDPADPIWLPLYGSEAHMGLARLGRPVDAEVEDPPPSQHLATPYEELGR
jgi:uncharacterized coiled-coil protein SlyX